ncbi:MAG: hypothetical protein KAX78_08375, partial [Phycisphaerae bacterium]|nr:hypothetical protein [Phycisphaerae bacterium]
MSHTPSRAAALCAAMTMFLAAGAALADPVPIDPFDGKDYSTLGVTGDATGLMTEAFAYGD